PAMRVAYLLWPVRRSLGEEILERSEPLQQEGERIVKYALESSCYTHPMTRTRGLRTERSTQKVDSIQRLPYLAIWRHHRTEWDYWTGYGEYEVQLSRPSSNIKHCKSRMLSSHKLN